MMFLVDVNIIVFTRRQYHVVVKYITMLFLICCHACMMFAINNAIHSFYAHNIFFFQSNAT